MSDERGLETSSLTYTASTETTYLRSTHLRGGTEGGQEGQVIGCFIEEWVQYQRSFLRKLMKRLNIL